LIQKLECPSRTTIGLSGEYQKHVRRLWRIHHQKPAGIRSKNH
jgi:hypothetical protein